MSLRSRAHPWWVRCDTIDHAPEVPCRWCVEHAKRNDHLAQAVIYTRPLGRVMTACDFGLCDHQVHALNVVVRGPGLLEVQGVQLHRDEDCRRNSMRQFSYDLMFGPNRPR